MEQFFDETKGDLKYILEEERRKQSGETVPEPEKLQKKASWLERLRNLIIILFFRRTSNN